LAKSLDAGTVLLAYRVGAKESSAFVVRSVDGRAEVAAVPLPVTAQQVWDLVDAFREACANPRRRWTRAGADLREAVFDPAVRHIPPGPRTW